MGLFNFIKKKETSKCGCTSGYDLSEKSKCNCENNCKISDNQSKKATETSFSVKVLGGGCAKCNALEASTLEALTVLGMDTTIEHVKDFTQIAMYGVMSTPALVINEKVVSTGKVLKTQEVIAILKKVTG